MRSSAPLIPSRYGLIAMYQRSVMSLPGRVSPRSGTMIPFAIPSLKISRFLPAICWPSPMMPGYHEPGKVAVVSQFLGNKVRGAGCGEFAVAVNPAEPRVDVELAFGQREVVVDDHHVTREVFHARTEIAEQVRCHHRQGRTG